jgi:hypothetical protein
LGRQNSKRIAVRRAGRRLSVSSSNFLARLSKTPSPRIDDEQHVDRRGDLRGHAAVESVEAFLLGLLAAIVPCAIVLGWILIAQNCKRKI